MSVIPSGFVNHATQLLQKVQRGLSSIELVYTAHEHWPLRPGQTTHARSVLRISVLDSSFNPPTLAHLALANSHSPPSFHHFTTASASTPAPVEPYDARLLLLSVRNADKVLKPGDATFVQRLEMMRLLLHDIRVGAAASDGDSTQTSSNVAIAIIDEPTFVGKSALLLRFLKTRLSTMAKPFDPSNNMNDQQSSSRSFPSPKLTFLLGFDTLVRLFSPKYYPSAENMVQSLRTFLYQEDCLIVCAYRRCANDGKTWQETQEKTFEVAREFITSNRIAFISIGMEEQTYSSSEVRAKVAVGDESWKRMLTDAVADYIVHWRVYPNSERKQ